MLSFCVYVKYFSSENEIHGATTFNQRVKTATHIFVAPFLLVTRTTSSARVILAALERQKVAAPFKKKFEAISRIC